MIKHRQSQIGPLNVVTLGKSEGHLHRQQQSKLVAGSSSSSFARPTTPRVIVERIDDITDIMHMDIYAALSKKQSYLINDMEMIMVPIISRLSNMKDCTYG